ncbi:dihydroorotase [Desulfolithobacter dissulfuricans]|uniref:Dihydroorotase n=1 Tax=Desulfolithobacter dissulfuricans TaxID=2795293 RepID=A0A915U2W8_9BACT|nr:dihydroorotase [Desulfolithobacter dissulfuricans]BCO10343.1 dihydroorotase [Desulfolithobacter dissulfuricans]
MANDWRIRNGRIIDPVNGIDRVGDLFVRDGVLVESPRDLPDSTREVDASGCWVVPGLIDMHVHLREPGEEYKEDIVSGTRAAAAGGFTAVACMPNTRPVNDCRSVTALILERAREGFARVYPVGTISRQSGGETLADFGEMRDAGVVAVSDDGLPVWNSQLMRRALEYAGDFGLAVISHSEEPSLSRHGVMNEGKVATRLGLRGIPTAAESIMVYREIALAEYTGRPVHIAHVSAAMSVDLIRRAKERGVPVTAETTPHYFTLTEEAVEGYNTNAKMNPPLRTEEDRQSICAGLADGTLDAIATDHAPHSRLEKEVEFDLAANGIIGLETSLPLSLALVRDGVLDPVGLVQCMSVRPAAILGVPGGSLSPGEPADITVIDPELSFDYTEDMVVSKSSNSPFLDWRLQGRAVLTMVGGRVTFELRATD